MLAGRLIAAVVAFNAAACAAESFTLHHRLGSSSPWQKRAEIRTNAADPSAQAGATKQSAFLAPGATYEDLTAVEQPWTALPGFESWSEELYQVALTRAAERVDETTPFTFVRACHLATDSDEVFSLHTDGSGQNVIGVNYELAGLSADQLGANGCPIQNKASRTKQVSVHLVKPQEPMNPPSPSAPIVKPDGTPLQPGEKAPEEPSFFRKYWYVILPVVIMMVIPTELADSNNEEGENAGGGDSTFSSGVNKGRVGGGGAARKR